MTNVSSSNLTIGSIVTVKGEKVTIIKLLNSSAKCQTKTGSFILAPYATMKECNEGKATAPISESTAKAAAAGKKPLTSKPGIDERKIIQKKEEDSTDIDDREFERISSMPDKDTELNTSAKTPKVKLPPREDTITKLFLDCGTNKAVITATKTHPAFININMEAWKRLISEKDVLGSGLFRMRAGNMLRGAINKKPKAESTKK